MSAGLQTEWRAAGDGGGGGMWRVCVCVCPSNTRQKKKKREKTMRKIASDGRKVQLGDVVIHE